MSAEIYDYNVKAKDGNEVSMKDFEGKVLLVVNTASKCGFTPQFEGLQKLYDDYKDKGLVVLGFPCDQFAHQDPGTDEEIHEFCKLNYGVNFPVFSKIKVNGADAAPVFKYLRSALPGAIGNSIKWNFTKFLIDKEGKPVKRFSPKTTPENIENDIVSLL
ncbi:MAG: glutathione peroxidase [Spirochaetales bacterium]|nr:glutathione peroxidase [Spirochaetales bacterium]